MNRLKFIWLIIIGIVLNPVFCQYSLTTLKNQNYQEITNPIYTVYDVDPEWNNIIMKPDFNFKGFSQLYNFSNSVYVVIQQGYIFFTNNTNSFTLYVAEGEYKAREGFNQLSSFSYKIDTVQNEKVLKMQWKNMGFLNGDSSHYSNFQVFIHANSGKITIHYGSSNTKPGLYVESLNGPSIGLLDMDESFSTIYNMMFLEGLSSNPILKKINSISNLSDVPENGIVYVLDPTTVSITENHTDLLFPIPHLSQGSLVLTGNHLQNDDTLYTVEIIILPKNKTIGIVKKRIKFD